MTYEYTCLGCGKKVELKATNREHAEYLLQGKLGWWQSMDMAGFVCSIQCAAECNKRRGIGVGDERSN